MSLNPTLFLLISPYWDLPQADSRRAVERMHALNTGKLLRCNLTENFLKRMVNCNTTTANVMGISM